MTFTTPAQGKTDVASAPTAVAKRTPLIVELFQELSRATNLPVKDLSDSENTTIFLLTLNKPAGISTRVPESGAAVGNANASNISERLAST